jgi:hypothetical protein
MRKISKKKLIVAGVATAVVAAGAGTALAYWTSTGSGSGNASVGSSSNITVNQTSSVSGLYPGGSASLSGNFDNPNSGAIRVGSVTATGVTVDAAHAGNGCLAADFSVTGSAVVNAEIPAGNGVGSWSGLALNMADTGVSQDACQGATLTVAYASN